MKYPLALALAISVAGCSAGATFTLAPSARDAAGAASLPHAVPKCSVSKALSPHGGFITLPSCFGFSGRIAYPYSTTNGTITAHLTVSTKNLGAYQNPKGTVYYMQWVFTSTSSSDTSIAFYHTYISPHDGCKIVGPFDPSAAYFGDFEVPNVYHPIKKTTIGITVNGTTKGHEVLGIPFVGTTVLAGVKNYLLISTSN